MPLLLSHDLDVRFLRIAQWIRNTQCYVLLFYDTASRTSCFTAGHIPVAGKYIFMSCRGTFANEDLFTAPAVAAGVRVTWHDAVVQLAEPDRLHAEHVSLPSRTASFGVNRSINQQIFTVAKVVQPLARTTSWLMRYDTRCYFNVRSKADMSRLNLPHGNDN